MSSQNSMPLNEWITKVHNMVEVCEYPTDSKTRIVRDILISGCTSEKAKDKIICELWGPKTPFESFPG